MEIIAILFVWFLGGMFVLGVLGASLVLLITTVEDVAMFFSD
ncbi:MAG: hypothetical protein ACRD2R_09335 [Terriglobales bacterium]